MQLLWACFTDVKCFDQMCAGYCDWAAQEHTKHQLILLVEKKNQQIKPTLCSTVYSGDSIPIKSVAIKFKKTKYINFFLKFNLVFENLIWGH